MIDPKKLFEKEQTQVLSADEKVAAEDLENFIDNEIKRTFLSGIAHVNEFSFRVSKFTSLNSVRKKIVQEQVFSKYDKFWTYKYEFGEDDGPNRPAIGYWVFTAKK